MHDIRNILLFNKVNARQPIDTTRPGLKASGASARL